LQEPISVPRHVQVSHVQGFVETELAQRFSDAIPDNAIRAMPEGPSDDARRDQRWAIVVEAATVDGGRARAMAEGPDTYGTTAVIAAQGALQMAGTPGCRAPAESFRAAEFLECLAAYGITWKIDG
jgi:short subunit dehydrogenase-like uncharacterized protein